MTEHDPLVRLYHVECALGISESNLQKLIKKGRLPAPLDTQGKRKYWRLSQLRQCNPQLADAVERLLQLPLIAAA
jgi:predicted DNA-binding transcriptional regulator AlpA